MSRPNRIINPGMTNWPNRFTSADRLRQWATNQIRPGDLEERARVSFARTYCLLAATSAEREGRPFTPIYWYFVDLQTTPIMTLWEMNDD